MITETQTPIVVLHVTDELLAQLHPFLAGLGITVTPRSAQRQLCLTMPAEVYEALVERVGSALDYEIRWRPSEDEPEGFVERVRPLELANAVMPAGCTECGAEVACTCDDAIAPF